MWRGDFSARAALGARMGASLARCLLAVLCVSALACQTTPPDPDATPDTAQALELDAWRSDRLDCDDGDGDCADWTSLRAVGSGQVTVEVLLLGEEKQVPHVTLTLLDAKKLTLLETRSAGRSETGLRYKVDPGAYFVGLAAASEEASLPYRLKATLAGDAGPMVAEGGPACAALELAAKPDLNFYDGQPHVLVIRAFFLADQLGFQQARISELLGGAEIPEATAPGVEIIAIPGRSQELRRRDLPPQTRFLGIAADYFRSPGSPEGSRKLVVPASCGASPQRVSLGSRDLVLEAR